MSSLTGGPKKDQACACIGLILLENTTLSGSLIEPTRYTTLVTYCDPGNHARPGINPGWLALPVGIVEERIHEETCRNYVAILV